MIKVTCYGKVYEYKTARQAINHFLEGMACSDGSEYERYAYIVEQLEAGLTDVNDEYWK